MKPATPPNRLGPKILLYKCEILNNIIFLDILPDVPRALVNINYGYHGCVHLGTEMDPYMTGIYHSVDPVYIISTLWSD